jgi:hypothetical protein
MRITSATYCSCCRPGGLSSLIAGASDWKDGFDADRRAGRVESLVESIVKGMRVVPSGVWLELKVA